MKALMYFNTILLLDKQRFLCKHCSKTFILMHKCFEFDISRNNNISTNTTNRILHDISKDYFVKNNSHLPSTFGIDEFMAPKDTISKTAFMFLL